MILNARESVHEMVKRHPGWTTEEIATALNKRTSDVSGRLSELNELGKVKKSSIKRKEQRSQTVWNPVHSEEEAAMVRLKFNTDRVQRQLKAIVKDSALHDPELVVLAERNLKRRSA